MSLIEVVVPSKFRVPKLQKFVDNMLVKSTEGTRMALCADEDDPSTIGFITSVSERYPDRVRLVVVPPGGGNVRAVNAGLKSSSSPYVCGMADDTYIQQHGWDAIVREVFESNPDYTCLALLTHNANGRNYFHHIRYPFCWVFEKSTLERLGYLNEMYARFGSDTHIGMQMVLEGIPFMECSRLLLVHQEEHDTLTDHNNAVFPAWVDSTKFHDYWDPKCDELFRKYEEIKDRWAKKV